MNHAETLDFLSYLPLSKPRLLRGPAGIGKDALVEKFADSINYEVVELALSELEPTDVVGMPYIHEQKGWRETRNARPHWWPTHSKIVLFLNELDLASEQMFPVAMRLAKKRMAGQLELPDGVVVFAAGNGDKYQRQPMDQALLRRFAVIDYAPTVDEWLVWAEETDQPSLILDFIKQNPSALDTPAELIGKRNIVVPTRASWADFGEYINGATEDGRLKIQANQLANVATPFVGARAAAEFGRWFDGLKTLTLNVAEIFDGKLDPTGVSLLQASHVLGKISGDFLKQGEHQQMNALNFYLGVGKEALAALFAELPREAAPIINRYENIHNAVMEIVNHGDKGAK